jgi:transcriptional regulator with XRE-family HTH domain
MARRKLKQPADQQQKSKVQEWGELIRERREKQGWTRSELLARYQNKLGQVNPDYEFSEIPSEAWLARIERGESDNVSRLEIDLLCEALELSVSEHVDVLLRADRNIFAGPNGKTTDEGQFLAYTMSRITKKSKVQKAIRDRLGERRASTLDESELLRITFEVLQELMREHPVSHPHSEVRTVRSTVD